MTTEEAMMLNPDSKFLVKDITRYNTRRTKTFDMLRIWMREPSLPCRGALEFRYGHWLVCRRKTTLLNVRSLTVKKEKRSSRTPAAVVSQ